MKLTYIEIEANAEEIKESPTLADALRDALVLATSKIKNTEDADEVEE